MTSNGLPPPLDYVAGQFAPVELQTGANLLCPNDGHLLEEQRLTSRPQLERALATAHDLHRSGGLRSTSADTRAQVLEALAHALEAKAEAIAQADAATTGVVLSLTRRFAGLVPHTFLGAARKLREGILTKELKGTLGPVEVRREPWGPAAIIAPWNAPSVIASHKVASALAAGAPVLLKASEWSPHSCRILAEAMAEATTRGDLPVGAFQLVHGDASVGAHLVADPRVRAVSFTGGLRGGLDVARRSAESLKPVQLELGGNNPLVVLDDLDDEGLDHAATGIVHALTHMNGQWCRALGRVLVPRSLEQPLLERTLAKLARVRLGDSRKLDSEMGPLVHRGHYWAVRASIDHLVARGGTLHRTTPLPTLPGNFLAPTLVTGCAPEDTLEEIFGPVACVHAYGDEDEALRLVAQSPYGLAGYVFGRQEERARAFARQMTVGQVKINGVTLTSLHPDAPRPAWGLSGLGDEGTVETLLFFTGTRVIGIAGEIA